MQHVDKIPNSVTRIDSGPVAASGEFRPSPSGLQGHVTMVTLLLLAVCNSCSSGRGDHEASTAYGSSLVSSSSTTSAAATSRDSDYELLPPNLEMLKCHIATGEPVPLACKRQDVALVWVMKPDVFDRQSLEWLGDLREEQRARVLTIGHPLDTHKRLVACIADGLVPINWPGDLRGLVVIKTPKDATDVLRIFSSAESYNRFPQYGYVEVAPIEKGVSLKFRGPAEMTKRAFEDLGLVDPLVTERLGRFRVRRSVARIEDCQIVGFAVLDEELWSDGRYALRVLWELRGKSGAKSVYLPRPQ